MMIDPSVSYDIATGVGTVAGKELVVQTIRSMVKHIGNLQKTLESGFKIEGQQMTIMCSDGIQKYSLSLTPKRGLFGNPKSVDFPHGVPLRVELTQMRGLCPLFDCVERTIDGFSINLTELDPGELYILDVEYRFEDHRLMDSLVERIIPRDVPRNPDEDIREYEMSAQLKHLDVLRQKYFNVNLRDLEFSVDVSVYQDINTKVPGIFRQQLEALVELSKKKGRSEGYKLWRRLYQLQQKEYGGDTMDILENMYDLFTPGRFRRYIDIRKDFTYLNCSRGSDYYDNLPFPTWPKSMKVISKTDLNYNKPAAEGLLVYNQADFVSEIERLFKLETIK
ncbi:hypothetical protein [Methanoculleus chikugoensis]|nr:hypothetical protein [Methanoculleus chikugoensis]